MFYRIIVRGVVQGVGFRPFIYREAVDRGLNGIVRNIGDGVEVIVDDKDFVKVFDYAPPLSEIREVNVERVGGSYSGFKIAESGGGSMKVLVPPDVSVCEDCLNELRDKKDRRFNYYYTTCTNCGPRYSMIEDFSRPYDRPTTTMRDYEMCESCRVEYADPVDRRYHAQTIACPVCGPPLALKSRGKVIAEGLDAVRESSRLIQEGMVVAVKGNGGFHLSCITTRKAVGRLREFTGRTRKPYAVMMPDVRAAREYCKLSTAEGRALKSFHAPIVLAVKKRPGRLRHVSELDSLGIMLPYTALHALLLDMVGKPVVMTSANIPDEPVSTAEEDVGGYCDYVLTHGRRIANRCDDSVVKMVAGEMLFLRRSRGYVPKTIPLESDGVLALGGEWENTITVTTGGKAYVSQYVGSVGNMRTFDYMRKTVLDYIKYTGVAPRRILCDMHPDFMTTEYGEQLASEYSAELVRVQHHLAHVCSVAAENNLSDFVGIACDGYGYGEDGKAWGGEIFVNNRREGSLEPQILLGGDYAARKPVRMLFSIMNKFMDEDCLLKSGLFSEDEVRVWSKQVEEEYNLVETTSTGRLLDAIAVLLGFAHESAYRGQHPMLLESIARSSKPYKIRPEYGSDHGLTVLKTTPLVEYIHSHLERDKGRLAATAHSYLAEGLHGLACEVGGGRQIVYSGGVAYNSIITGRMLRNGVLVNTKVPCGDGGLSFGQAAYDSIFCD
ncbi:MAG: carbamoyltransferase HypF [Candidatus Altiarchaeota archaeon]